MDKSICSLSKEFGWPKNISEKMVLLVHQKAKKACHYPSEYASIQKKMDRLKAKTKLREVFDYLEDEYSRTWRHYYFQIKHQSVLTMFESIGITRIDSIIMPQKTVTLKILKTISKENILGMDARILGTMSATALLNYGLKRPIKKAHFPTVGELLKAGHCWKNKKIISNTIFLLRELGFSEEDGPFMKDDDEVFIDKLMREEKIDKKTAQLIVAIAKKRGWKI